MSCNGTNCDCGKHRFFNLDYEPPTQGEIDFQKHRVTLAIADLERRSRRQATKGLRGVGAAVLAAGGAMALALTGKNQGPATWSVLGAVAFGGLCYANTVNYGQVEPLHDEIAAGKKYLAGLQPLTEAEMQELAELRKTDDAAERYCRMTEQQGRDIVRGEYVLMKQQKAGGM